MKLLILPCSHRHPKPPVSLHSYRTQRHKRSYKHQFQQLKTNVQEIRNPNDLPPLRQTLRREPRKLPKNRHRHRTLPASAVWVGTMQGRANDAAQRSGGAVPAVCRDGDECISQSWAGTYVRRF